MLWSLTTACQGVRGKWWISTTPRHGAQCQIICSYLLQSHNRYQIWVGNAGGSRVHPNMLIWKAQDELCSGSYKIVKGYQSLGQDTSRTDFISINLPICLCQLFLSCSSKILIFAPLGCTSGACPSEFRDISKNSLSPHIWAIWIWLDLWGLIAWLWCI